MSDEELLASFVSAAFTGFIAAGTAYGTSAKGETFYQTRAKAAMEAGTVMLEEYKAAIR